MTEKMEDGKTKISKTNKRKSVDKKYNTKDLKKALDSKEVFDVYIKNVDAKFNLIVIFADGIKGIIPREEVSCLTNEDGVVDDNYCLSRKNKIMQVCIKEIEEKDGKILNVMLSRKILENKVRNWMYNNLKPGIKLYGVVTAFTDYAAFVDVGGGVKAFLKVEDISSVRINKPEEKLSIGQKINVIVTKYDRDTGKIEVSMKALEKTFEEKIKNIKEGDIIDAVVKNRTKTGIFLEIKNNLTVMAEHVSGLEYGQNVLVYIKRISIEKERIRVDIIG